MPLSFYNCIIGWRCDEINQVKLEAYGLTRYYNIFSPGSSAAIKDRNLRPIEQACAYENLPVEKVVHKSLLKNAQDVVEMLEKMVVGLEPLNKTLAWAKENDRDLEEVSIYYLKNYEDRWRS